MLCYDWDGTYWSGTCLSCPQFLWWRRSLAVEATMQSVLRITSGVFLSAHIRYCSVPLILWVSSRFHSLSLCLADDAGCISAWLNPGCAEHDAISATDLGAIPNRHGFKHVCFKRGQKSLSYCKAQPWEVKKGSGDSGVWLFFRGSKKYQLNKKNHPVFTHSSPLPPPKSALLVCVKCFSLKVFF